MTTQTSPDPKYAKYNASSKGQARRKKYEDAHPERRQRWSVIMVAKGHDRNGAI